VRILLRLGLAQRLSLLTYYSTGGIIALGLGVNEWSVSECKRNFVELISQAFTKRPGGETPFGKQFNLFVHQSRYRTETMEAGLKHAFGESESLFGQSRDQSLFNNKVAVTATSPTGERAFVMTNYNRRNVSGAGYSFDRESDPANEIRVWEA